MANSIDLALSSLLVFVLSLLFSNAVVPLHAASPNDVASTLCQKTRNPSFCSKVLSSAGTTDLKGLVTFTLNLAHKKATESIALAQSLESKATDPNLKECYISCSEHFDNAAGDLGGAKENLVKGDYNGVNIQASAAMTEAGECQECFKEPLKDSSALCSNGKHVEDICSIILVLANHLLGSA